MLELRRIALLAVLVLGVAPVAAATARPPRTPAHTTHVRAHPMPSNWDDGTPNAHT